MKTSGGRFLPGTLLLTALALLAGCSTADVEPHQMAVGSIRLPADAGRVGLTISRRAPEFVPHMPNTRPEAAQQEAADGAKGAAHSEFALLFPAGFVLGGFYGWMAGVGEDELKAAARSIQAADEALQFDERIIQAVRAQLTAACPGRFRNLEDNLPLEPHPFAGRTGHQAAGPATAIKPPPASLKGTGVDTVIGLRLLSRGFKVYTPPDLRSTGDVNQLVHKHNPPLSLVLTVDVVALRTKDWAPLGGVTITYESTPRRFMEWAGHDAQLLRQEMDTGLQYILSELTIGLAPEVPRT